MGLSTSSFSRVWGGSNKQAETFKPSQSLDSVICHSLPESQTGVMPLLFKHGNFKYILEDIFFHLDPTSLLSCSLVSKDWSEFLKENIWIIPTGENRLSYNWVSKEPLRTQLELGKISEHLRRVTVQDVVMVEGKGGMVDLYHHRTGQFKRRLEPAIPGGCSNDTYRFHRLESSSRYKIIVYTLNQKPGMSVFATQRDFQLVPMRERYPGESKGFVKWIDSIWSARLQLTEDIMLLRYDEYLYGFHISEKTLKYDHLWQIRVDCNNFVVKNKFIIQCPRRNSVNLKVHTVTDGKMKHNAIFDVLNTRGEVEDLAYADPMCLLLIKEYDSGIANRWISVCDMERSVVPVQLEVGLEGRPMGDLFCNTSVAALPVWHKQERAHKILVWDLQWLMPRYTMQKSKELHSAVSNRIGNTVASIMPARVLEISSFGVKFPLHHARISISSIRVIYSFANDDEYFVAECNFWGRL